MYWKYQIIKILENCFQNMNWFSWIKKRLKFYPGHLKPHFKIILIMFFIGFSILSYAIQPRVSTSIGCTKTYARPIKFIIKLYTDHNTLWVKHATHQKAEFLRSSSLTKLDNTVKSNSIPNTKYSWFLYKMVGTPSFSQPWLCVQLPLQSLPKICFSTWVNFHLPVAPLLFHKIILAITTKTPFLYTSAIFHLPVFVYNYSNNLHQKNFHYLSHLANLGYVKGPMS